MSEREKYETCYQDPRYRMGEVRKFRALQDVLTIPAGAKYLDVGCGRGETIAAARYQGIDAYGLEMVPGLCGYCVTEGLITAIPFDDNAFDFVSCYDVVEHLPTDQVDRALDELFRVCGGVLFLSTNDKPSFYQGLDLHLTRKPREWWDAKLRARARSVEASVFGRNEWHWRCTTE